MVEMPVETKDAIIWAEQQTYTDRGGDVQEITFDPSDAQPLVDKVCVYFDDHTIKYPPFDYPTIRPIIDEILAEQQPEEPIEEQIPEGPAE
jgi:hypothetical protein